MPLIVKPTPTIEISASDLARLKYQYQQAFQFYCGAPPDFDEWAIARLQSKDSPHTQKRAH